MCPNPISEPITAHLAVFFSLSFVLSLHSVLRCHLNIAYYFKISTPPFVLSSGQETLMDSIHVCVICCTFKFTHMHQFHLYKPTQQPSRRHSTLSAFLLMCTSTSAAQTTRLPFGALDAALLPSQFVTLIAGMLEISTPSNLAQRMTELAAGP